MAAAAQTVPDGCPLTPRQFAILCALANGKTVKQVALSMGVAASTIRTHMHHAYRRLGVTCDTQAVGHLLRSGWLGSGTPAPRPSLPLSHFQRAYLAAFDEHLQTHGDQSRRAMRIALYGARNEAGLEPNIEYRPGREEPLDRLLGAIGAVGRRQR